MDDTHELQAETEYNAVEGPERLSWLSICLWFRSWSQGLGIEPHVRLLIQQTLLLPLPLPPACAHALFLCQIN